MVKRLFHHTTNKSLTMNQELLDAIISAKRQESLKNSDQLTVGAIIQKLEPIVAIQKDRIEGGRSEAEVYYDFEYLYPTRIDSWRGSYSELALNYTSSRISENSAPMKVTQFYEMMKGVVGKEFDGYKGGEFLMTLFTPVWVANNGNSGSTAVVDIIDRGYNVIIVTGFREY